MDLVEEDLNAKDKKIGGIMGAIQKRYRERKAKAKKHFKEVGRYDDLEGALKKPAKDMKKHNWVRAVEHFCSEKHMQRSAINTTVRQST